MASIAAYLVTHAATVQALFYGAFIVSCWCVEQVFLGDHDGRKQRRARINGWFVVTALPIQVGLSLVCVWAAYEVTLHQWGLLYWLPWHNSVWVKYVLMFVLLDFLDWLYHYTMHHVPVFWRFHLVHHTDRAMDASTTVREHPGETAIRNGFLIMWVVLCGASIEVLMLRQAAESASNILAHTSFRLRDRTAQVLGWLLITPNLHHVHHHQARPYTDSNYGDVFSVWDRLFGTFATLRAEDTVFGLDTHMKADGDERFGSAFALPFKRRGDATA